MVAGRLPPPRTPEAAALLDALKDAGYFYPLIGALYAAVGLCCVSGRFLTLATLALGPMVLNVLLFHAVLSPGTLPAVLLVALPWGVMLRLQWGGIAPLLRPGG
jgi:hypothetical protein